MLRVVLYGTRPEVLHRCLLQCLCVPLKSGNVQAFKAGSFKRFLFYCIHLKLPRKYTGDIEQWALISLVFWAVPDLKGGMAKDSSPNISKVDMSPGRKNFCYKLCKPAGGPKITSEGEGQLWGSVEVVLKLEGKGVFFVLRWVLSSSAISGPLWLIGRRGKKVRSDFEEAATACVRSLGLF